MGTNLLYPTISLLTIAILVGLILRHQGREELLNEDALSATSRAKSSACREELKRFALLQIRQRNLNRRFVRECKLDTNVSLVKKVGCATPDDKNVIKVDRSVHNVSSCLDVCISYGHEFGGFDTKTGSCYCGDGQQEECHESKIGWYEIKSGLFRPSKFNRLSSLRNSSELNKRVKIAFLLVLRGKNLYQIQRLLRHIYSPHHLFYIHVDGRDSYLYRALVEQYDGNANLLYASRRRNTIWGGTSLLQMYIDAFEDLRMYEWDFLINLSESDYPVKPLQDLESYLRERYGKIFLKSHSTKGYDFIKKQGLERSFYQCEDHLWNLGPRDLPLGIIYSGGSDWFVLPRSFCSYISDQRVNRGSLVSSLIILFNHTLLPAESFFHTLALNSEFCDKVIDDNLRLTNWHRRKGCKCQHKNVVDWCGCSPLIYRKSNWDRLKQTARAPNIFFSRKFDPTISSSILDLVDKHLLNITSNETSKDTRFWTRLWPRGQEEDKSNLGSVLRQLATMALVQIEYTHHMPHNMIVLEYFAEDRFVGLVFEICFSQTGSTCIQFLVERNLQSHLVHFNPVCFKSAQMDLKLIEVNHGFDTGEQMFRRYDPLSVMSDIIVYHEWFLSNNTQKSNIPVSHLKFNWINPQNHVELRQRVDFRKSMTKSRLSLAHKLGIEKPIKAGLWKLRITLGTSNCLEYDFTVFSENLDGNNVISQDIFNRFFKVTRKCLIAEACKEEAWWYPPIAT